MTPRLILFAVVFFVTGIYAGHWVPAAWHPAWLLLPVVLTLLVYRQLPRVGLLLTACFVGVFTVDVHQWYNQPTLEAYVGQSVTLRGQVLDDPTPTRFTIQLTALQGHPVGEKAVVRLKTPTTLHHGDLLELQARLERPAHARNPGGFDAWTYYTRQGVNYSIAPDSLHVIGHDDRGIQARLLYPLRHRLLAVVRNAYRPDQVALISGIVLGVEEGLDPEVKATFRELGIIHILAVSGANVSLLILPLLALLKKFGLTTPKRYSLAIVVILLYGGLAGGGASVTRACTMSLLWCLSRILARDPDPLTAWALAAGILLTLDPFLLTNIGFQLTFLLTLALLIAAPYLEARNTLLKALLLTFLSELISTPLVLTISPVFTPLSLLANLYILPLIAFLTPAAVLSILLGLLHPALATLPAQIVSWALDLLVQPLTAVGNAGWLVRHYQAPAIAWLWLYYGGWLLVALRRVGTGWYVLAHRTRQVALLAIACALSIGALWRFFAPQDLRVTFLDVGQGDSILIEMPHHHVWLVDGGGIPQFQHSEYDIGERIVLPALAARGIDEIDTLVMTHADEDHIRGLAAVLQNVRVHHILVSDLTTEKPFYQDLLSTARQKQIPITQVHAGQSWTPETDLQVTILNPPVNPFHNTRSDTNANCIVFTLTYLTKSFLFTGDFEGDEEPSLPLHLIDDRRDTPASKPASRHIDVLKVAHHGSAYSTTLPFLRQTTPTHAVVSAGAHNHYGHPAPATLQRLGQAHATLWRTDAQGAIVCTTDGQYLDIYSWLERGY
ncbi:DNA internalization-related competence protein ComEC/Rec2 [Tumebacillus permanentifrigoris]|uniref:Competence protein ComEC n=1 Tax=Tumebacillus permanentifrigoris TaxID=378543 RepID=A0A316DEM2_9BACL|nr:DNA internalization-related competence protein ComEC/Rec2 [Tumebacillus permanentifrigoris]PWK16012.1 competence protein ComEC [Tumebacillus permanentifrigoris]